MNILFISDVYFPRINGVSTSIKTFRDRFTQAGHRVVLIAPDYGNNGDDDNDIIRIPSRRIIFDHEDRLMCKDAIKQRASDLKQIKFDLVHIQTPFIAHTMGVYLSRLLNIPRLETYHTFFEEYFYHYIPLVPKKLLRHLARRFTSKQCNNIHHIITPSSAMQDILKSYGVTTAITVLPTGIDTEQFSNGNGARFREKHNIRQDRPVLTHIGRVAHEKNIDFLIKMLTHVWQEIPDILLLIAGEGPAVNKLKRLSVRLGLKDNVLFVGYQDRLTELNDCYSCGDAFVFASRTETQGLVLLESMSLGIPVVSTAIMGTRDILGAGMGALVADEHERQFAIKVIKLLNNEILRKRLGAEGRQYVQAWSADTMAFHMLDLYQTLCKPSETQTEHTVIQPLYTTSATQD